MSHHAQMPASPVVHAPQSAVPRTPDPTPNAVLGAASPTNRPLVSSLVVLAICALSAVAITRVGWSSTDDGAGVVPLIALAGIALAGLRWRPADDLTPTRMVSSRIACSFAMVAVLFMAAAVSIPALAANTIGPVTTGALVGTYLALWGYRGLALLRTVSVLSLLTWQPVALFVHDGLRTSLEQPSALIYRRLAQIPAFGVEDEPWRLFSAELHRGALVTLSAVVLAIGANRWRMTARTMIDLVAMVTATLVAHHVAILAMPIDDYSPDELTALATNPGLEVGVSAIGVAILAAVRFGRTGRTEEVSASKPVVEPDVATRDRVIFAITDGSARPITTALLLAGVFPLASLALQS